MNKNILIAGLVLVALLVGVGGYLFMNQKKVDVSPSTSESQTPTDVITSIKDAFSTGASFECTYTDEGRTSKTYVKNGMVRAEISSTKPEESGNTIIKDKKMYFWNASSAFMMEIPEVSTTPGPSGTVSADDLVSSMEKFKDSCKLANVSDEKFVIPADVKFQDMTSMMKKSTGGASGGGPDQKEIEEMMKKYLTPTQASN